MPTPDTLPGTPSDDAALVRLRAEMSRPPFHAVLRPEATHADAASGTVVVTLPYRPEFGRDPDQPGHHGGVIAALIDLVAHAAVAVRIGRPAPTIDLRIDYLRASRPGALQATGRLRRAGRTTALADVEVTDIDGREVATGRGVFSTAAPAR